MTVQHQLGPIEYIAHQLYLQAAEKTMARGFAVSWTAMTAEAQARWINKAKAAVAAWTSSELTRQAERREVWSAIKAGQAQLANERSKAR